MAPYIIACAGILAAVSTAIIIWRRRKNSADASNTNPLVRQTGENPSIALLQSKIIEVILSASQAIEQSGRANGEDEAKQFGLQAAISAFAAAKWQAPPEVSFMAITPPEIAHTFLAVAMIMGIAQAPRHADIEEWFHFPQQPPAGVPQLTVPINLIRSMKVE